MESGSRAGGEGLPQLHGKKWTWRRSTSTLATRRRLTPIAPSLSFPSTTPSLRTLSLPTILSTQAGPPALRPQTIMGAHPDKDNFKSPKRVSFQGLEKDVQPLPLKSALRKRHSFVQEESPAHEEQTTSSPEHYPAFPPADSGVSTSSQNLFTHHTGPEGIQSDPKAAQYHPSFIPASPFQPRQLQPWQLGYNQQTAQCQTVIPYLPTTYQVNMSQYALAPANTGVHFQPQVGDTSTGPELHYYTPRHDGQLGLQVPVQQATQYMVSPPYTPNTSMMPQPVVGMQYPLHNQISYQVPYQSQYQMDYQTQYQTGAHQAWGQQQMQTFASVAFALPFHTCVLSHHG